MDKLKQKKQQIMSSINQISHQETPWSNDVVKKIINFSSQGKMLRGSLFLRTYEILGGTKDVTKIAAALEITQSGILAHDDVMDKDDHRRSMPTIHKQYQDIIPDEHYSYSMAICFGDIAFFESFKHIPKELINIYCEEMINCAYGQMQDIQFTYSNKEPTKQEILEVYKLKTARYTFSLPMMLAAKLTQKNVELFKELGEHLGIIFQIIDDEIGLFSSKEQIGKTPGSDIEENKKTLHRHFLLQQSPELKKLFGKKPSTQELETIREHAKKIKPKIQEIITIHHEKSKELIQKLSCDKKFFEELSNYNLNRLK